MSNITKAMKMSPTCLDMGAIKPCADVFITAAQQAWIFLKSDGGHIVFASLATVRAIFYYLRRSPLPEADQLANAFVAGLLVLAIIAITENKTAIKNAFQCKCLPATPSPGNPKAVLTAQRMLRVLWSA
jgi:hypothetical protein